MYIIEKTDYGFKLIFADTIKIDEMTQWVETYKKALQSTNPNFKVFVDARMLNPFEKGPWECMRKAESLCLKLGMQRSVLIFSNVLIQNQFKKLAEESGIDEIERQIDATRNKDWKSAGLNWILNGVEPEFSIQGIQKNY